MNPERGVPKRISRRSFLQLLALSTAALATNSVGIDPNKISIGSELDPTRLTKELVDEIYPTEEKKTKEEEIVEEIKTKFNIDVHHTSPTNLQGEKNYPQELVDLMILFDTLQTLPPIAFTSNKMRDIHLYKVDRPSLINGMIHSGYSLQKIDIILSTDYRWNRPNTGIQRDYYGTQGRFFSALLIHEFGHLITENYQDMYQAWIKHTKWSQDSEGKWTNFYPEQISQEAEANLYPWEDFSASLSLLALNKPYFKNLSPNRYYFFENNPMFSDWSIIKKESNTDSILTQNR